VIGDVWLTHSELSASAGIFICDHVWKRFFAEFDLPDWGLIYDLLSFFWNEKWKDLILRGIHVLWMEHSLNVNITEGLVEVHRQEEFTSCLGVLSRGNDDVGVALLQ
jgi:hypothetical protein